MNVINDVYKRDLQLLLWCVKSRHHKRFIAFVRIISKTGDGYMQLALPIFFLIREPSSGFSFFVLVVAAFAIERPIYFVLKNTLKRPRPPEVVPHFFSVITPSDQFSFPSGHTMASFLLASLTVIYFGSAASVLYIWAVAVGASRVILGVHFPTDIFAGACLGTGLAFFTAYLMM